MKLVAEKKYLAIPVYAGEKDRSKLELLEIFVEGAKVYEFRIPKADRELPSYYAYVPVGDYQNKELECKVDGLDENVLLEKITQVEEIEYTASKDIHHHAPYGWINDPNGMIYENGVYHLYYQHNPMNTEWENMSWGHSVSKDMVHFEYVSDVLFPDEDGTMFSGCAILNERGCFGLPKDAILFFYSVAGDANPWSKGKPFIQKLAYSLDHGKTLQKYEDWTLPHILGENRDPKIFWHEETSSYVMSLFLEGNIFAILRSADLEHWEESDRFELPPMWECPDLFKIKSEDNEEKWAFMSADGYYYLGDFDGYKFRIESEMLKLYESEYPYAAQSFSGLGERVVSIAWLRTKNHGKIYRGMMSVPREFSLGKDTSGYYVKQSFVKEAKAYIQEEGDFFVVRGEEVVEKIDKSGRIYITEEV